ncbi:LPS export ABC transporter periplasmic protein LptC [Candidatus Latescibacterota bacterium]
MIRSKKIRFYRLNISLYIYALSLLILFFIIIAQYTGCGDDNTSISGKSAGENEPDQVLINPRIVISEKGLTSAIIQAKTVKVFEKRNFTSLKDSIVIYFYNDEGIHTTTLTAHTGEVWGLYESVDSLSARGNVVIVSGEDNASMETEDIRWIASIHRIHADGLATIKTDQGFEQGTGFVAKDDLSEFEFTGPVSGEIIRKDIQLFDR